MADETELFKQALRVIADMKRIDYENGYIESDLNVLLRIRGIARSALCGESIEHRKSDVQTNSTHVPVCNTETPT